MKTLLFQRSRKLLRSRVDFCPVRQHRFGCGPAAVFLLALLIGPALAEAGDELAEGFRAPPDSARPLTWWHWLNGTITRDGITADLEAMKRAGLGGCYLFNCGGRMPEGDVRFMQPKWLEMMDHTVREAERLGLKFGVHNCDGFSQSGGPWIKPETSMKELTWTTRDVDGPAAFDAVLEQPHAKEDFYRDIAVVAFPLPHGRAADGRDAARHAPAGGTGQAHRRQAADEGRVSGAGGQPHGRVRVRRAAHGAFGRSAATPRRTSGRRISRFGSRSRPTARISGRSARSRRTGT